MTFVPTSASIEAAIAITSSIRNGGIATSPVGGGGTGVGVGGTGVALGGTGVAVGGIGVAVGVPRAMLNCIL
ncbi:MAG: hypothetical protein OXC95_13335, partial [Dehalococcoidia bacterium]|nr:hypothetical protein [Dehalococcoidia bacterium]